ncbi:MAG TPA: alpha/beta hydrolase [Eubacteriales bacterium]|nr:alpha/beta hydrolase [Eubacteriales bacterium]
MTKKIFKIIGWVGIALVLLLLIGVFHPTWTPRINSDNSISELRKVEINNVELEIMIRGSDRNNPVVLFVHGGPCCSEIPYVRKYQDLLEQKFTVVHYDQRGSGKSYEFGADYSSVSASDHVDDLISITQYIEEYLNQDKVILIGHSYGTYIATMAAAQRSDLYSSYIGIGQLSNTIESELDSLHKCIQAAQASGNFEDVIFLSEMETAIARGEAFAPRNYIRKYGFAARQIDDNKDYITGFLFGSEYNLLDAVRFFAAANKGQEALLMETMDYPISDIVTEINLPVYFVMGKYDGMTSPQAAEEYLKNLQGHEIREFVIFENSAHYPQFEEKEKFYEWICNTFINDTYLTRY